MDARFCGQCGRSLEEAPASAALTTRDPKLGQTMGDPQAAARALASLQAPSQPPPAMEPAPAPAAAKPRFNQTMLQGSAVQIPAPAPAPAPMPAPPPQATPAPAPEPTRAPTPARGFGAAQTMLGMPATSLPVPAAAPAPAPAPAAAPALHSAAKTIVGMAVPGSLSPAAPKALPSAQGTLLGMAAVPAGGKRPAIDTSMNMPAVLPAPAPLVHDPLPAAPQIPGKRGVSALTVVLGVMGLLAVAGGVAVFLALRGGAPITAQPQLDEGGRESLKLTCASCPDGTRATLGAKEATFAGNAATLALPAPLSIGENELVVRLDRPGAGRDEDVKIAVPVAYRVRADLTTAAVRPPAVTVRIEAAPGSEVTVDGKPVALDGDGKGSFALDVSAETEGPSRSITYIERTIPFTIVAKGKTEKGELKARVGVVPMQLDAPGTLLYTDRANVPVAGQTKAGATLTVDGAAAPVDAEGRFGVRAELPAKGEKVLEIVAASSPLAPRVVRARVVRVPSLDAKAKELEQTSPLTYAGFGADPKSSTGKDAVVEGEIVEVRSGTGYSVLLVDDKRACNGPACLVRVVFGEETKAARGSRVRAYGKVTGAVSASGKSVPEIEASLLLPVGRGTP